MPDIKEVKMTDLMAVSVIQKIRGCHYDENCNMKCESCPCNFSVEELHEALGRATEALRERNKE